MFERGGRGVPHFSSFCCQYYAPGFKVRIFCSCLSTEIHIICCVDSELVSSYGAELIRPS